MNISAQINVINSDKGPGDHPRRPKCVLVSKQPKNIWFLDIGKKTTTRKLKSVNVKKWLKTWYTRLREKLIGDTEHRGGVEEGAGAGKPARTKGWKLQIRQFFFKSIDSFINYNHYLYTLPLFRKSRSNKLNIPNPYPNSKFLAKTCVIINKMKNLLRDSESEGERGSRGESGGESDSDSESEVKSDKIKKNPPPNEVKHQLQYIPNSVKTYLFYISNATMISLTIYLMLLAQTVEKNPGPKKTHQTTTILTYNTNGLGDNQKLKRLLTKIDPMIDKGGIALLQETHIVKTDYIKMLWKHKFVSNCISTNSAGVITLFSNDFVLLEEYSDNEGRISIIVIKSEDKKVIVANTYYPNNHKQSLTFANKVYEEILRLQQNFPDFDTIYTGDINTCLKNEDCLNRNRLKIEETLSTLITENNKVIKVADAYRKKILQKATHGKGVTAIPD